jgi:predicted KAP-like P-loop ATPase
MGRRSFAEHLAQDLLTAPRAGFVVALTGARGSGKTSILNMAVDALGEDALVIHFNPWMFSGTEALVAEAVAG